MFILDFLNYCFLLYMDKISTFGNVTICLYKGCKRSFKTFGIVRGIMLRISNIEAIMDKIRGNK